jgi:hypothetical protein
MKTYLVLRMLSIYYASRDIRSSDRDILTCHQKLGQFRSRSLLGAKMQRSEPVCIVHAALQVPRAAKGQAIGVP